MLNKFLYTISIILISNILYAQTDSTQPKPIHRLGFQVNTLLREIIGLNTTAATVNPIWLEYGYQNAKRSLLYTAGFGTSLYTLTSKNPGDLTERTVNNNSVHLSTSFYKSLKPFKGFTASVGVGCQLILKEESTLSTNTFINGNSRIVNSSIYRDQQFGYSIGPSFRLHYTLLQKLQIGLESHLFVGHNISKTQNGFTNRTFSDDKLLNEYTENTHSNTRGFTSSRVLPNAIFVYYTF